MEARPCIWVSSGRVWKAGEKREQHSRNNIQVALLCGVITESCAPPGQFITLHTVSYIHGRRNCGRERNVLDAVLHMMRLATSAPVKPPTRASPPVRPRILSQRNLTMTIGPCSRQSRRLAQVARPGAALPRAVGSGAGVERASPSSPSLCIVPCGRSARSYDPAALLHKLLQLLRIHGHTC